MIYYFLHPTSKFCLIHTFFFHLPEWSTWKALASKTLTWRDAEYNRQTPASSWLPDLLKTVQRLWVTLKLNCIKEKARNRTNILYIRFFFAEMSFSHSWASVSIISCFCSFKVIVIGLVQAVAWPRLNYDFFSLEIGPKGCCTECF